MPFLWFCPLVCIFWIWTVEMFCNVFVKGFMCFQCVLSKWDFVHPGCEDKLLHHEVMKQIDWCTSFSLHGDIETVVWVTYFQYFFFFLFSRLTVCKTKETFFSSNLIFLRLIIIWCLLSIVNIYIPCIYLPCLVDYCLKRTTM